MFIDYAQFINYKNLRNALEEKPVNNKTGFYTFTATI
jgi:hypothetical protein